MIVTFCGHREVSDQEDVRRWLTEEIERLIASGATTFYLGGYGAFDQLAAAVIREQKEQHPEIRSVLVLPYMDKKVNEGLYDETLYPPLENVPKRYAITHRNRWMVDRADVVLCYVLHDWGGAYTTMTLAQRRGKIICNYLHTKFEGGIS